MSKRMISFEIPDELREQLRVEAFERKLAISATIREILEQYFKDKLGNEQTRIKKQIISN